MDQIRSKRLGQLATRLYTVLLTGGLVVLMFYTIIQPQILTKVFEKPSLNVYKSLLLDHNDTLHCPCSSISLTYDQYITTEPVFHQVRR